ncbi:piwi-like protein Ago3 isoform X2 [Rhodnius prolixus]|uniref:piwi-like protein Ago3 isoform X2 n=1 Tax=Rhodnius prolixus TaxID=13249 RepID=UPI003D18C2C3
MAYRGSRGSSRGGRGEALMKLLQKSAVSPEEEEFPKDIGVQGGSSQAAKPMGRSAALMKLLESASGRGAASSSKEPSHVQKRESFTGRETSIREPEQHAPPGRMRYNPSISEKESPPEPSSRRQPSDERSLEERFSELTVSESYDRPAVIKKGTYGQEVKVAANYIRLNVEKGKGVFQYDVKFNPDVDSTNIRCQLMKNVTHIIGETKSFDGSLLYLPVKLPEEITTAHLKMPTDGSNVTMKITYVKKLCMGDRTTVHLYNVLFRKIMQVLGLTLQGRHFFDPKASKQIPAHNLEVWPGYITAIQEYEDGIMLCCDSSHRVLRTQTVLELMEQIISVDSRTWKDEFIKLVIGQTVLTRYNNKMYRVDDVSFDESPKDKFEKKDGTKMSYIDYYFQHYNIKISNTSQPLLKSRVRGRMKGMKMELVNLVPELCHSSGLTETIRADMRAMKDIAQTTRISPSQRQFALNEFINSINSNSDVQKILSSWGLSLAKNIIRLPGRVIPPENIYFGNDMVHSGSFLADWGKAAASSSVLSPIDLRRWAVICTNRDEKTVEAFVDMYRRCLPQLGIKMSPPQILPMQNDSIQTYIKALQSTLARNLQIVVIVFPTCRIDKYSAVKKWCCIDHPIPSQVIQTRTIRKPEKLRSVTQKIALQINCKLGGALWTVDIPLKHAMVIGLDTFHDASRQGKSVGAVVSSLNKGLTRWYSKIYSQAPGIELIEGLEVSILACLQKFKAINGVYPEQILIYRDGVGDGQLDAVEKFELPQIITACRRISPNYDPKFLFVIVQKHINTRIFTEERGDFVNPLPGTVLDHSITRKNYWDFFLVSQSVRQGTVSPTHYIVLHNTTKMTPDQVQRFTYKLTHLYYNWCGTVRVPAPCQYAHKLASLVGESIHKEASESLAENLFFL